MKFRRAAPAALIIAVAIVVVGAAIASNRMFAGMTATVERSQFDQMEKILNRSLKSAAGKAQARAELIASLPATRRLMAAKDRDGLLAEYKGMYDIQHARHEVEQMMFALPPATALLRLHSPGAPVEDVSSFRPLVVAANRDHLAQSGVSVAKAGPAIFAVVPIQDDAGNHLGSFEVGIDIGALTDSLKSSYGLELGFFVEEALLRKVAVNAPPEVFDEANRVGHYLRFHATHAALLKELAHGDELDGLEEPHRVIRRALGETYGVLLVPVRNPLGQPLGVMVVAQNFSGTRAAASRSVIWQALIALFAIVILAGVILVVVRGFLLQPLRAIVSGKPLADDEILCDELRELAQRHAALVAQADPPAAAATAEAREGDAP